MVRLKNRYIIVEIIPEKIYQHDDIPLPLRLNPNAVDKCIQDKVEQLHGHFGMAAIRPGFKAKYCNDYTRIAIVRCRHGPHKLVTSSIPFIKRIDSNNVCVNILYVGASIRKCFNFVKVYQERKYDEFCVKLKTDEDKIAFKDILINFDKLLMTMNECSGLFKLRPVLHYCHRRMIGRYVAKSPNFGKSLEISVPLDEIHSIQE